MQSETTLSGVSSLTVKHGDTTIFMDVEDFTIVADDGRWFDDGLDMWLPYTTYSIKEMGVVLDNKGVAYTVVKQKPVVRTAEIEVEGWSMGQIKAAQSACSAPEDAAVSCVRDGDRVWVHFEWEGNA